MTVKPFEIIKTPWDASGIIVVKWAGLKKATDDTGEPFICPHYAAKKSVQLVGTLGVAGACTVEGSNMKDSPTYATLNDPQGNALVLTALKIEEILENTYVVRPSITAGDANTLLDVYLAVYTER